ncbi:MAG: hypothetical protein HC853_02185 [Anaerolineae bacterium]|nr:hypothetical protein [Anaerolineae bacterium]
MLEVAQQWPTYPSQTPLVDNWVNLVSEDAESSFPKAPCTVSDYSQDSLERTWGYTSYDKYQGDYSLWPARGGRDAVDPATQGTPANLISWLECGPFDLRGAQSLMVRFAEKLDLEAGDSLFTGISTDDKTFTQLTLSAGPITSAWTLRTAITDSVAGASKVWVAWVFRSSAVTHTRKGAWLDNAEVWYRKVPTVQVSSCGKRDPGIKGINLPPYDPTVGPGAPMIRPGDVSVVDHLKSSNVHWVRLEFVHQNGQVDLIAYDRMVDTLCQEGIGVLGLVDNQTLARQDFNQGATAASYQAEFASRSHALALHFKGRIVFWEVWNEPNFALAAYMEAERYASLLKTASDAIKAANPDAKVLFGGLASAWNDSHTYFTRVLFELREIQQVALPFDIMAIHPYPDGARGLKDARDPRNYLYAFDSPMIPGETIIDRFVRAMEGNGTNQIDIWITELGWNSSKGTVGRPTCQEPVLVTEREQGPFIKAGFDVLLNNVYKKAVKKLFVYQYMDVGSSNVCVLHQISHMTRNNPTTLNNPNDRDVVYDWLFGLYRSDKHTAKPSECWFRVYPASCPPDRSVYLPMVTNVAIGQ